MMRDSARNAEEQYSNELRLTKQRFESETLSLRTGQEQQLSRLKASFDREANSIRASYERELTTRRSQTDLDMVNVRSGHAKEISMREGRISTLEASMRDLRRDKDVLFEESQTRQAEVESATSEQARLKGVHEEMQYELKEARDRISALQDEVQSFKKARLDHTRDEGHTRRLLVEMESNSAEKIRVFEERVRVLEKERSDTEERMAKKLQEKLREVEKLRREIEWRDAENGEETQRREERQHRMDRAESANRSLQDKLHTFELLLHETKEENDHLKEDKTTAQDLSNDQHRRISELEGRNEELQNKEVQLKSNNKTLREELRKIQSGILLSEKSRNPGVGYFSNFSTSSNSSPAKPFPASPVSPLSPSPSGKNGTPTKSITTNGDHHYHQNGSTGLDDTKAHRHAPSISTSSISDGENADTQAALNFEYIRNVILQFLEHKEMRVSGVPFYFDTKQSR